MVRLSSQLLMLNHESYVEVLQPRTLINTTKVSTNSTTSAFGHNGLNLHATLRCAYKLSSCGINECPVWAHPRSLAATKGVSFDFFSCRYWDVSLPCVSFNQPMNWAGKWRNITPAGFPHSEILGSMCIWPLPEAYRSLSRLSSPISAKASTCCPY